MALNPNAFLDGVMNGFSLHIEPPSYFTGGLKPVKRCINLTLSSALSPPVKYFTDCSKAVLLLCIFYYFSVLCSLCLCARLFICALWSPAGKELTS